MLTSDVLKYFGGPTKVAAALGISSQAVSQWGRLVPPLSATRIEIATKGDLKFDPSLYNSWNKPRRSA